MIRTTYESKTMTVLIGPCGIETSRIILTRWNGISVLIGPCGIETRPDLLETVEALVVLIGPCGIETLNGGCRSYRVLVLIGPCGIETFSVITGGGVLPCINWTLRN